MVAFVADFETTTRKEDCRVWAYATCEIGNEDNVSIGTTIDDFMRWCSKSNENYKVYFHNLKFDGSFILYWLFKNGYEFVSEKKDRKSNTFTTLISDKGLWYSIEVIFHKKGRNVNKVTFLDSLKLIPLSVDQIAKSFNMSISKLEIDYTAHDFLPVGAPVTEDEKEYVTHDVKIVARALDYFFKQGLDKMTIGSCALNEYKKLLSKKLFKRYFPLVKSSYHNDLKQSYRGGFTYLNPKFAGKIVKEGVVLDVNSLYPYVMYDKYLPYGTPIFFKGQYKKDLIYPLFTQMLKCQFELKPGKIPTVQIKYGGMYRSNDYLTESKGEVVLCLNSVDLDLFFEQYEVYNVEYLSGWKFRATKGLFDKYIEKWSTNKIEAKKRGDHGMYLISKLFLNSLYGKFGTDNKAISRKPVLGEDGIIHYEDLPEEEKDGIYIAMASFITSYAREKTIKSAQKIQDDYNAGKSDIQFIYADTDSLHCLSPSQKLPSGLDIDDTKLGAWKFESKFKRGKYLRQKCYIEDSTEDVNNDEAEYKLKITVAGMPISCYEFVNFRNFKLGASYKGKKLPLNVEGGVVLSDVDFTIKE